MGNLQPFACSSSSQSPRLAYQNRVNKSLATQPIHLECRIPYKLLNQPKMAFNRSRRSISSEAKCGPDSLNENKEIRLKEISSWLSSVNVIVYLSCKGYSKVGSGIVIGPRYVLTSASNIFNREIMREAEIGDIIVLAINSRTNAITKFKVVESYYSKKYGKSGEYDFALLALEKEIADCYGCLGLKAIEEDELSRKLAYFGGFEREGQGLIKYRYYTKGPSKMTVSKDLIYFNVDTRSFLIGSGLYYKEDSKYYAVGMLVQSLWFPAQSQKIIHLNSSIISKIEGWIRRFCMKYSIITHLDLSLFPYSTLKLLNKQTSRRALDDLITLDLSSNLLENKGAKTIARLVFKSLRSLNLERNYISYKGAYYISRGNFHHLEYLKLGYNQIGPEGAHELAYGKLKNLISLSLQDNLIRNEGAIELARGNFINLTYLNLRGNNIDHIGVKHLSSGNCIYLTHLNLACNCIDDYGAVLLSQGNFIKLRSLDVSDNLIGIEGARALSNGKLAELIDIKFENQETEDKIEARISRGNTRKSSYKVIRATRIGDRSLSSS